MRCHGIPSHEMTYVRPPMVNAASAHAELVCLSMLGELRSGTMENIPPDLASSSWASADWKGDQDSMTDLSWERGEGRGGNVYPQRQC